MTRARGPAHIELGWDKEVEVFCNPCRWYETVQLDLIQVEGIPFDMQDVYGEVAEAQRRCDEHNAERHGETA